MRGIIYTRVSSDEQVKGTSLEFQEDLCKKYCQDKGIEIVSVFKEEGESAKDLSLNNRKKFLEALEFCRKNKDKVQAFVVLRVDRFARNADDHFAIRKILATYGTTLHSVTEPIGNEPVAKLLETFLAGIAEFDNAIRKQRCSDGMLARINQGIYPWKPPIGYRCLQNKKHGEKKTQPDPPHEEIFPIIQRGLKEFAQGLHSQSELARKLDEWGLKDLTGKKTPPQLVSRLVTNYLKFYAGIITNPWTEKDVEGLHKPMITKNEMYQILMILSGKKRVVAKYNKYNPDFPLRRTVLCGACGRALTGSAPRGGMGGRYNYYHCKNKTCAEFGKSIKKADLEREFIEYLARITPNGEFLSALKEVAIDVWQAKGQRFEMEVEKWNKKIEILEAKKKRIYEMREDGSYTKEEFMERKDEVENEITATRISVNEARIEQFDLEGTVIYATKFIKDLGRQWFDLVSHLQPKFQKLVFPDGIPYERKKGFGTAKLGVIYELNQHFADENSHLVDLGGIEPPSVQCECTVLPLYYRPMFT